MSLRLVFTLNNRVPQSVGNNHFRNWSSRDGMPLEIGTGAHLFHCGQAKISKRLVILPRCYQVCFLITFYSYTVYIGSIQELEELSGVKNITDLHRESIDNTTIHPTGEKGTLSMKRSLIVDLNPEGMFFLFFVIMI
jgi:hypothetical protein